MRDKSTQRRPEDRRDQRGPGEGGDGFNQLRFWRGFQHGQPPDRHHQRPPDALNNAQKDKFPDACRHRAEQGGKRKNGEGKGEYIPRPKPLRCPAAGRDQHRQRQHIRAHPGIEIHRRHPERYRHLRECGGDHRAIDKLHEESRGNQ